MLCRSNTNRVTVFFKEATEDQGPLEELLDQWDEKPYPTVAATPPPGLVAPRRGFGYIWHSDEHEDIREKLGWAKEEKGFCGWTQDFEHGFIWRSVEGRCVDKNEERKDTERNFYHFGLKVGFGTSPTPGRPRWSLGLTTRH